MAIKTATPNFDGAARGVDGKLNIHLDQALRAFHDRLTHQERATQLQASDPDIKSKLSQVPGRAHVNVRPIVGTGNFTVSLTNPEFQLNKGNPLRTPIYHKISYSADPSFRSGVTELPPSTQTHWPIAVTPKSKLHFKVASSHDGVNWNQPIITQAFTA